MAKITLRDRIRRHRNAHPNDHISFKDAPQLPPSPKKKPTSLNFDDEPVDLSFQSRPSPCRHGGEDRHTRWCNACQANVCRLCKQTGNCHGVGARRWRPGQSYRDDPGHRLDQDSGRGLS